jgi:DNA-binding beta-propeller fold protein YncE
VDPRGHPIGKFPFSGAQAAAIDRRGDLLVAGAGNVLMNRKSLPLTRPDPSSSKPVRDTPGMAVDRDGRIYVVDGKSGELLVYGRTLDFRSSVFRSAGGSLGDVKVGFDNQVYLLDTRDRSITVLAEGKTKTRILLSDPPASIVEPVDFAVDDLGDLYVCDAGTGKVVVLDPTGKSILATLGGDRSKGGIAAPEKIEVDRQGRIYVYDRKADAILRFK